MWSLSRLALCVTRNSRVLFYFLMLLCICGAPPALPPHYLSTCSGLSTATISVLPSPGLGGFGGGIGLLALDTLCKLLTCKPPCWLQPGCYGYGYLSCVVLRCCGVWGGGVGLVLLGAAGVINVFHFSHITYTYILTLTCTLLTNMYYTYLTRSLHFAIDRISYYITYIANNIHNTVSVSVIYIYS